MAKTSPTHVGLNGKDMACYHCGKRETVIHGQGLAIGGPAWKGFMAHCNAFEKLHGRCKETAESPTRKIEQDELEWEIGLFVGTSSATIFKVMVGRWPKAAEGRAARPSDPSDFGRCHRLLKVKPIWRSRLNEVAENYPAWLPLVEHWDELTTMFENQAPGMYDRMKVLLGDSR